MSLPPSRIGDQGQRYEVRWDEVEEGDSWQVVGYTNDRAIAERMADCWRLRPSNPFVWVVDRSIADAPVVNECKDTQ